MPRELELLRYIDRFGIEILGRPPGAGELRKMSWADRVVKAYASRARAENWAQWAADNKADNELLILGARLTNEQ